MPASHDDAILRFRESERQLHWAIAVPFMVSWLTAIVLVAVYNPHPERPLRFFFSWVHRASGLWLCVLPLWTVLVHRRDLRVHLQNIREAWWWTLDDLKWLALMGPAALSRKVTLPDQGKFNAAEKINFMSVMSTYPLYIITGLLIWLPGVALLAWLVHFALAVMATPLILGHIFMATINRETRVGLTGMLTGYVPREWAKHHYRRWYVQTFEAQETTSPTPAPAPAVETVPVLSAPVAQPPAAPVERPLVAPVERPLVAPVERPLVAPVRRPLIVPVERPLAAMAKRPTPGPGGAVATAQ